MAGMSVKSMVSFLGRLGFDGEDYAIGEGLPMSAATLEFRYVKPGGVPDDGHVGQGPVDQIVD